MTTEDLVQFDRKNNEIYCSGNWSIDKLNILEKKFHSIPKNLTNVIINGSGIHAMDSAAAWLLSKWQLNREKYGTQVSLKDFPEHYENLLNIIKKTYQKEKIIPKEPEPNSIALIGHHTLDQLHELRGYLAFIGMLTIESFRLIKNNKYFRISALSTIIYRAGFLGLPIIALLSFMIGVVITYQMTVHLREYGANWYIVDLLGITVLREFGPLITAIMVAGRTGSAFTAQLGMMKINQEIDALNTMGITPAELLLLPRILGLMIAVPLLTIWADIFGVLGGMVMANGTMDISWHQFLSRFQHTVKLKHLLIGLFKSPVFALIIATIGCFEGMRVKISADSVGLNTTRSVVLAIFFIIVADAAFSIIFSLLRI